MRLFAGLCCSVAAVASGSGRTEHAPRSRQPLLSPLSGRTLYLLTAVNPMLAALSNDYSSRVQVPGSKTQKPEGIVSGVYRTLFYFARLKPRLMFSVGAALRALQMTTALQVRRPHAHPALDPSVRLECRPHLVALPTPIPSPRCLASLCLTLPRAWAPASTSCRSPPPPAGRRCSC